MYDMKKITDISEVPVAWVYKFYYKKFADTRGIDGVIHQPFDGRTIRVRSLLSRDTNPSMFFYYNKVRKTYFWKDFSTGKGGDCVELVAVMLSKFYNVARDTITRAYESWIESGFQFYDDKVIEREKPKYTMNCERMDSEDLNFWGEGQIDHETLNRFWVRKLSRYDIIRNDFSQPKIGRMYGYYSHGGAYQIYQPNDAYAKYLTLRTDYIMGSEQLKFKANTLAIVSGLKDIMAMEQLDLDVEYISGYSENSVIKYDVIDYYRSIYPNIVTMFDYDKAGAKGMQLYKAAYDIDPVYVRLENDHFDNLKKHKIEFLIQYYAFAIDKAINNGK